MQKTLLVRIRVHKSDGSSTAWEYIETDLDVAWETLNSLIYVRLWNLLHRDLDSGENAEMQTLSILDSKIIGV